MNLTLTFSLFLSNFFLKMPNEIIFGFYLTAHLGLELLKKSGNITYREIIKLKGSLALDWNKKQIISLIRYSLGIF